MAILLAIGAVLKVATKVRLQTALLSTVKGKVMPEAHGVGLFIGLL